MIVRIPQTFLIDHEERGLPTPPVIRASGRHFWIDSADAAFAELLSDAEFYGGEAPGTDDARMTRAARALLAALRVPEGLHARACVVCGRPKAVTFHTVEIAGRGRSVQAHLGCFVRWRKGGGR